MSVVTVARGLVLDLGVAGSIAGAAYVGYHSALHGGVGALVLAVMALGCWQSYWRGRAIQRFYEKAPAYEFLRMAKHNVINAGEAVKEMYLEQRLVSNARPDGMTFEERQRRDMQAMSYAAYRQAIKDAKAVENSPFASVQYAGSWLEEQLKTMTAEQFYYQGRAWPLYDSDLPHY